MKTSKRRLVILSVAVIAILVMALTAVAVYAVVWDGGRLESLLGERGKAFSLPAAAQDPEVNEPATIYDQGVLVRQVDPESPAAVAGIRRGSIILSVDGTETNTGQALKEVLAEKGSGATVTLSVLNSAVPEDVSLALAETAPYLGVQLVVDTNLGQFGAAGHEECVCGLDLQLPEDLEGSRRLPEGFGLEGRTPILGVYITEVIEDSAAAAAGLEVGDMIETVDGEAVTAVGPLADLIKAKSPGDTVTMSVVRANESQEFVITLGANPDDANSAFLGVLLSSSMGTMRGHMLPMLPSVPFEDMMSSGAVIVEVVGDTAAATAGLQPGDVIQAIDGEAVSSVDALVELIGTKNPGDEITLAIQREGESQDIAVTLGTHPDDVDQAYLGVQLGAFFDLHIEQFKEGDEAAPGQFFFHMQPGRDLNQFLDGRVRQHLQLDSNELGV